MSTVGSATRAPGRLIAGLGLGAGAAAYLGGIAIIAALAGGGLGSGTGAGELGGSQLAHREIPSRYLQLYHSAAARYGIDWAVLAGIGEVECDHGRDPSPSCTHAGVVNSAGAGGPMQFLAATWARYGVAAEGAGPPDRWNAADAIYGAANYLRASGAPSDYRRAIFAYNHASWYVEEVLSWAARYRGSSEAPASSEDPVEGADVALAAQTTTPVIFIGGEVARLDPGDGHVALIPAGVPAAVQALLVAGNELQGLPYGPDGHPDPLGASEEDCSSTVNYVLYRAGLRPLREIIASNPVAQDYVDWGEPGPGRWVTIYAAAAPTPHVFIVVAGLRLDTARAGIDEGPNRLQDGPRWRILDGIPHWERWSVRHPPGL